MTSYRADKLVIDARTDGRADGHTYTQTDAGNDNTRRPKLASGKKYRYHHWYSMIIIFDVSYNIRITSSTTFQSIGIIYIIVSYPTTHAKFKKGHDAQKSTTYILLTIFCISIMKWCMQHSSTFAKVNTSFHQWVGNINLFVTASSSSSENDFVIPN